jgi:hypothetical protein
VMIQRGNYRADPDRAIFHQRGQVGDLGANSHLKNVQTVIFGMRDRGEHVTPPGLVSWFQKKFRLLRTS